MAYLRKSSRSKYWLACYRDSSGRQTTRTTRIRIWPDNPLEVAPKEAARLAANNKKLAQQVADTYEETSRGNLTEAAIRKALADIFEKTSARRLEFAKAKTYLASWLDSCSTHKSASTYSRYRKPINDFLAVLDSRGKGDAVLADIAPGDVQEFLDSRLKGGRNPSTVKVDLKILNAPFNTALRQGLIPSNPVSAVDLPSSEMEARRPFSPDQVRDLIRVAMGSEWETLILLGAYGGLRIGDAASLRWDNVDLPTKQIRFRPSKTRRSKRDLLLPMHPALERHFLSMGAGDLPDAPVSPDLAKIPVGGKSGLSRRFLKIMSDAGIEQDSVNAAGPSGRTFNRYGFHSLRHTFVSGLESAGVGIDLRQKLAGHADQRTNVRYSHTEWNTLFKAIASLPS